MNIEILTTTHAQILLTIAFSLSLMYSVLGAIIAGSVFSKKLHPCFMCLFSCVLPASMVGLGFSLFGHEDAAVNLMVVVILFLCIVSYCIKKTSSKWQSSHEPQTTGN